MIIIKMPHQQMEEMGECIEKGLHYFGKAMTLYSSMKQSAEDDGVAERRYNDMEYRTRMRRDEEYRYPDERRGYGRY